VVLAVGFVPVWLFLVRRPEDMGLEPDRIATTVPDTAVASAAEPGFSRHEAIRTPAFWLLMLYTVMIYPVQAGVSLHQAAHLTGRGLDATTAAFVVSSFALMSMLSTAACAFIPRRLPVRLPLAAAAALMGGGTLLLPGVTTAADGFLAAGLFGLGLGAMLTLTPIAWAEYFGRASYGAIRSYALSAQVLAQAAGPLLSGLLFDWTGTYAVSLHCFTALSAIALMAALAAIPPRRAEDV
jgi:cyanate permease